MNRVVSIFLVIMTILGLPNACFAQNKWDNLLVESGRVFEEMAGMPEQGIPKTFIKNCYAVAIFPSTVGGGFFVGGKYGQGLIIAKDKASGSWGPPAVYNLAGASFGWQIGAQATDIVLLIMTERSLDALMQSKLKLGGDASVAAGPVGREAEVALDLHLKGGILSYSRSRGAFIGAKLEGALLSFNKDANYLLYGEGVSAKDILINKTVTAPESASRLIDALSKY